MDSKYFDKKQLEQVLDSTGVGIWVWDVQTGETAFNERWANIIGYTLEEISPVSIDTWMKFAHDDDLPGSEAALKACWAGETEYYIFESRMHHKSGELVWVYDTGKVVEWLEPGVPKLMIGTHLDITQQKLEQAELKIAKELAEDATQQLVDLNFELQAEVARRKQVEGRLNQLAHHDFLTGLPNRLYLENHFREKVQGAEHPHASLVFFDLDNFKELNDSYGHSAGDAVLVEVALHLQDILQDHGVIGRIGGDEFIAMLSVNDETLEQLLGRVLEGFQQSITSIDKHGLSLSAGVCHYPQHGESFQELVKKADHAMYLAKKKSGNHFQVHVE